MKIITEKNVSKLIIYLFIVSMTLMAIFVSYIHVKNSYDDFNKDMEEIAKQNYEAQKQNIKKEVEIIEDIIRYNYLTANENNENVIKQDMIRMLHNISFQEINSNYIFVYEINNIQGGDNFATMIVNPNRLDLLGKSISTNEIDSNGKKYREEFLKDIRTKGESFTQYAYKKPSDLEVKQKISYFKHFPEWNWVIAVGVYLDDINKEIKKREIFLKERLKKRVSNGIFVFLGFLIVAISFSALVSNKIEEFFKNYKLSLQKKSNDLIQLNNELEKRVQEELSKNREKEQILVQKSKLIALGEMISNIAHQWRQPLSELSTILMSINFKYSMDKLEKDFMQKKVKEADVLIEYMSNTIDDFRYFFMPRKNKEKFHLNDSVQRVMNITGSVLKNNNIVVEINIDKNIVLETYLNEYEQVILNIISNAKDALIQSNIENPKINIYATEEEKSITLFIEDNAGGIKSSPISKIFEPYFTTKDDDHGTGIGLYMSKIIIEKNIKGKLKVSNINCGALFEIIFIK